MIGFKNGTVNRAVRGGLAVILLTAVFLLAASVSVSAEEDGFGELKDRILGLVREAADTYSPGDGDDVFNILLVGVDRRDTSWNGNSDSMILFSVNGATKKVTMMSFMRDLQADLEGYGARKLNAACAVGGPSMLVKTLESNFGVKVDNYVCVDFFTMIDLVDAVGGFELEISDEEAELANGLMIDMAGLRGESADEHLFPGGGYYTFDGYRAVSYSRIRFVGNNDYERTERQRKVLKKLLSRVKEMGAEDVVRFAAKAVTIVNTDIDAVSALPLAARVPDIIGYTFVESRVPFDGMYHGENEMLVPDQPATNDRIAQELYG